MNVFFFFLRGLKESSKTQCVPLVLFYGLAPFFHTYMLLHICFFSFFVHSERERNGDTDRGRKSGAILLPFPVSVEPGVFRERAERSPGRQPPPMGQDILWKGEKNHKTCL